MRAEIVSSLYFLKTKYLTQIHCLHCKNSYGNNTLQSSSQVEVNRVGNGNRFTMLKTIFTLSVQILQTLHLTKMLLQNLHLLSNSILINNIDFIPEKYMIMILAA